MNKIDRFRISHGLLKWLHFHSGNILDVAWEYPVRTPAFRIGESELWNTEVETLELPREVVLHFSFSIKFHLCLVSVCYIVSILSFLSPWLLLFHTEQLLWKNFPVTIKLFSCYVLSLNYNNRISGKKHSKS